MATELGTFIARIRRAVDDVEVDGGEVFYSDDIIQDAIAEAHKAVLPWHPKLSTHVFTSGSGGETNSFALPDDFYGVDAFRDDRTGIMLPSIQMLAQGYIGEDIEGNEFYLYPTGYITLAKEPTEDDTFTMFYRAYWSVPTASSGVGSEMEIPSKLETALLWFCCAYLLTPEAVSSASIRQWNTRADSGNPEHNPVAERSKFFMRMFMDAVMLHQAHSQGVT